MDLLYTKYMKALIGYRGIQRIEQFMFSRSAMREILLNDKPAIDEENLAIVHENLAIQRILLAIDGSDCSASTARYTISKMRDLEVIIPIAGRGKGKYKWNLAFQADNDLSSK